MLEVEHIGPTDATSSPREREGPQFRLQWSKSLDIYIMPSCRLYMRPDSPHLYAASQLVGTPVGPHEKDIDKHALLSTMLSQATSWFPQDEFNIPFF